MDMEWLHPEQIEQILKFCELASVEDLAVAANILEQHSWNLEVTTNLFRMQYMTSFNKMIKSISNKKGRKLPSKTLYQESSHLNDILKNISIMNTKTTNLLLKIIIIQTTPMDHNSKSLLILTRTLIFSLNKITSMQKWREIIIESEQSRKNGLSMLLLSKLSMKMGERNLLKQMRDSILNLDQLIKQFNLASAVVIKSKKYLDTLIAA